MRNPRIVEAMQMFEHMTKIHADDLYESVLYWKEVENKEGDIIQLVPVAQLKFKF